MFVFINNYIYFKAFAEYSLHPILFTISLSQRTQASFDVLINGTMCISDLCPICCWHKAMQGILRFISLNPISSFSSGWSYVLSMKVTLSHVLRHDPLGRGGGGTQQSSIRGARLRPEVRLQSPIPFGILF